MEVETAKFGEKVEDDFKSIFDKNSDPKDKAKRTVRKIKKFQAAN
jgi:hypothetical protein